MFIDGKQKTEIHSNKTKASCSSPMGLCFMDNAHRASGHMHTCSQAFRPHASTCSKALRLHACFKPKGFCKLQPRQQAHEKLQHVESQAWLTIVQRHVPDLFGSVDLFVWPLPLALLLPIMPSVFIEQWQDPQTLALFERVWVSSYWRRAWTRHDYVLYFNAKYALKLRKLQKMSFKARKSASSKKINLCNKKRLANAN